MRLRWFLLAVITLLSLSPISLANEKEKSEFEENYGYSKKELLEKINSGELEGGRKGVSGFQYDRLQDAFHDALENGDLPLDKESIKTEALMSPALLTPVFITGNYDKISERVKDNPKIANSLWKRFDEMSVELLIKNEDDFSKAIKHITNADVKGEALKMIDGTGDEGNSKTIDVNYAPEKDLTIYAGGELFRISKADKGKLKIQLVKEGGDAETKKGPSTTISGVTGKGESNVKVQENGIMGNGVTLQMGKTKAGGVQSGYFSYDGSFQFESASAFEQEGMQFTDIARGTGNRDRIHLHSASSGSTQLQRVGPRPMDFNISFTNITNATFTPDSVQIENASSVTINANSSTGTEHNLILTDIKGLSFGGENLSLDHADSMIVNGEVVAINSDDITVPFSYTHQLFNYSLYLEEYQEITLNSSDMVKVAHREYRNLARSRFITNDEAITYANVSTHAERITYNFVNPFQDIPDIKTTLDKGERVEYVNHNSTVLLDTQDVVESVIGSYGGRESVFSSYGGLTLANATRDTITVKARGDNLLIFNGSRLIANTSRAQIISTAEGATLVLPRQKITLPSSFSEGTTLDKASIRADDGTVVVSNADPVHKKAYQGTDDVSTRAKLFDTGYTNLQPTCTISSDGTELTLEHGGTQVTIQNAGDITDDINTTTDGIITLEKDGDIYTTKELLETFADSTITADENTSIALFTSEVSEDHHMELVAFYGDNRSHEKTVLRRRAREVTTMYIIRMQDERVTISDGSTSVTVTNLESAHSGVVSGTFIVHSGNNFLTAGELMQQYANSSFTPKNGSFAAVFTENPTYMSDVIASQNIREDMDPAVLQSALREGASYEMRCNGSHLTLRHGNETRTIDGVSFNCSESFSASVAFRVNETLYSGQELWKRAENETYTITDDMGILIYNPQETRHKGGIEVSTSGEAAAFREARGTITTRSSSSIIISYEPPYEFSIYNGEMTLPSRNKTEHIGTINMVSGTFYNKTGYRCFFMEPDSAYAYADTDTPLRDFGIESVEYYHLCLRKYEHESFPSDCKRCGLIDFLNKTMELNNEVRYLRYPYEEKRILRPVPHLAYEGKEPAEAYFDFGPRMIEIETMLLNKTRTSTISETDAAWKFFAIHEKEHRDKLHRVITLNPELLAQNAYNRYMTTFGPKMHMQNHILTQENTNTIKIVPPRIGSEIFNMR